MRVVNPAARGSEPGDPDARYEKDFHLHWEGFDYLICTRGGLSSDEMEEWPGEIFERQNKTGNERVFRFYVRHIGEWCPNNSESALESNRKEIMNAFCEALAWGWGGLFSRLTSEQENEPRYAIIKIAPNAEVKA